MKPRIIQRIETIEGNIEAEVLRVLNEKLGAGSFGGAGVLVGTVLAFSGDMAGVHPINPVTRATDKTYALCNGTSYYSKTVGGMLQTPDLQERFILGAGGTYLVGNVGGSIEHSHEVIVDKHTLTLEEMPNHKHGRTLYMSGFKDSSGSVDWAFKSGQLQSRQPTVYRNDLLDGQGGSQPHTHGASSGLLDHLPPLLYPHVYYENRGGYMRNVVTVIPSDGTISVNGDVVVAEYGVEKNIHAIQWNMSSGHIEYSDGQKNRQLTVASYNEYVVPFVNIWERHQGKEKEQMNLEEVVRTKTAEIIEGANHCLKQFTARYSQCEVSTWPMQETGARIMLVCEETTKNGQTIVIMGQESLRNEAVALIKKLASERGVNPQKMAEKVLERVETFSRYQERIFTEQRAFCRQVADLQAMGKVEEIAEFLVKYVSLDAFT